MIESSITTTTTTTIDPNVATLWDFMVTSEETPTPINHSNIKNSHKPSCKTNSHDAIRTAFVHLLESEDNKYHFTVSYIKDVNETRIKRSFNELLKRLNKKIFGRNYFKSNKQRFLHGWCVQEQNKDDIIHFHVIFQDPDNSLPEYDKMYRLIDTRIMKLKTSRNGRRCTGDKGWELQNYYNNDFENKLETYVTKQLEMYHIPINYLTDHIMPLALYGVTFMDN